MPVVRDGNPEPAELAQIEAAVEAIECSEAEEKPQVEASIDQVEPVPAVMFKAPDA